MMAEIGDLVFRDGVSRRMLYLLSRLILLLEVECGIPV